MKNLEQKEHFVGVDISKDTIDELLETPSNPHIVLQRSNPVL